MILISHIQPERRHDAIHQKEYVIPPKKLNLCDG